MLSGDGNENSQKISVGELAKKQLCTCSTLFLYISLPTGNFQKIPNYTFCEGNVVNVRVQFFPRCRSFSPWWSLAFFIFLPPLQNVFLPMKLVSFVFISGSSSFSVIHVNVEIKMKSKERIGCFYP